MKQHALAHSSRLKLASSIVVMAFSGKLLFIAASSLFSILYLESKPLATFHDSYLGKKILARLHLDNRNGKPVCI